MQRRNFTDWALVGLAVLAVANVWRLYAVDRQLAYWMSRSGGSRDIGSAHAGYERLAAWAPEDHRPHLRRATRLLAAARSAEHEDAARALRSMAKADYERSLELAPGEAQAILGLSLSAESYRRPTLAEAARARAPSSPAYAWSLARSMAPSDPKRPAAYRKLTGLAPRLTPRVLDELGVGTDVEKAQPFVAQSQAPYRWWAWSVTAPRFGRQIALAGLELPSADKADTAWLHYYVGIHSMEEAPADAREHLKAATELLPQEQAFHRNRGFALLKTGRTKDAEQAFRESIRLNPDMRNAAHLGLAQAFERAGHDRRAERLYERLSKNPRLEDWVRREAGDGLYRLQRKGRLGG